MPTIQEMLEAQGDIVVEDNDTYDTLAEELGLNAAQLYAANQGAQLNAGMSLNLPATLGAAAAVTPQSQNYQSGHLAPPRYVSGHLGTNSWRYQSGHLGYSTPRFQGLGYSPGYGAGFTPGQNPLTPGIDWSALAPGQLGQAPVFDLPGYSTTPTTMGNLDNAPALTWDNAAAVLRYAGESMSWVIGRQQGEQPEWPRLETQAEAAEKVPPPVQHPFGDNPGIMNTMRSEGEYEWTEEDEIRQMVANHTRMGYEEPGSFEIGGAWETMNWIGNATSREELPDYLNDKFVNIIFHQFRDGDGNIFVRMEDFYDHLGYEPAPEKGPGTWKKKRGGSNDDGGGGGGGGYGYGYGRGYGYGYPSYTRGAGSAWSTPGLVNWRIGIE